MKFIACIIICLMLTGCYYRITDPDNNNVYYTESYSESPAGIRFEDMHTGAKVTLDSAEVVKVKKAEAQGAVYRDRDGELRR